MCLLAWFALDNLFYKDLKYFFLFSLGKAIIQTDGKCKQDRSELREHGKARWGP